MKEVDFEKYCQKCVSVRVLPYHEPCFSCMEETVRRFSHKPVRFKEEDKNSKKRHTGK